MANDQGRGPDSPSQSDASGASLPDTTDESGAPTASDSDAGSAVTLTTLPWAIDHKPDSRALPSWFRRAVVMVLILVILSQIAVWAFGQLTSFWYTLFLSFFLGITMEPLVNRLARRGIRRGLGTFIVLGGLLGATAIFFLVFGQLFAEQLAELISSVPELLERVVDWVNDRFGTQFDSGSILETLGISTSDLAKAAANLGVSLLGILGTAIGWVFSFFTILLFAFYFAADGPSFRRSVASWLPPARQRAFLIVWDVSTEKAGGYVLSRGIMAVISAAFHGIAFAIIGLPYWLPLAMWVGLVSQFIPTIGTYLAGALPVVVALVYSGWPMALAVLLVIVAYQQIENYFVSPRVTRNTLEIHPAVAFGSVIVGGTLFGGVGALLAIPVVATIQSLVTTYGRRYQLISDFGTDADSSDLDRMDAAIRASDGEPGSRGTTSSSA